MNIHKKQNELENLYEQKEHLEETLDNLNHEIESLEIEINLEEKKQLINETNKDRI